MWEDILMDDTNKVPFSLHNQGKDLILYKEPTRCNFGSIVY